MHYEAPLDDIRFALRSAAALDAAAVEEADEVLRMAARLCEREIAPGNRAADVEGAACIAGTVRVPQEIVRSWKAFAYGGWIGLHAPDAYGGQGLPKPVQAAVTEMLNASNLALGSGLLLCEGAIEALLIAGSPAQKDKYLPHLVRGTWSGTMNLTEPQAGSDLSQIRTMATPDGDRWRLRGQKLFITFGEQDFTENILHFVLARTPGAPQGIKGISLFAVPKFLAHSAGQQAVRNDIRCVSIEHKLGIRASPTCLLAFGEGEGAVGELVGELHRGLDTMFLMMNAARFTVGVQGIGIAERAYQAALAHAGERVQGKPSGWKEAGTPAIVHHPDVRRLLMTITAQVQASRALAFYVARCVDAADESDRAIADFLVPVHKGHATELAVELCSMALQVFGGMGFVEDTGVAQYYRDARILPIYEGTTAIQANDLVGRKTLRDGGKVAQRLLLTMREDAVRLQCSSVHVVAQGGVALMRALAHVESALTWMLETASQPQAAYAASVPFLRLVGHAAGAWQMARAMELAAAEGAAGTLDARFASAKVAAARFYLSWIAPQCAALAEVIAGGPAALFTSGDLA